jgi:uncharacterized protein YndB with AHSA1/START domain
VLNTVVAHINRSRTIAADRQAIWGMLADFGALSTWAGRVDHSCLLHPTAQPVGLARRVQVGRTTLIERIVEFEPPAVLAYDIEGLPTFVRGARNRWQLRSESGQSTEVTLTSTINVGDHLPQRIAEWLVCRVAAEQSVELLAGLAAHWENAHVA